MLVVNHVRAFRQQLQTFLRDRGYDTVPARSVEEALALGLRSFHAVIADTRLGRSSGTALIGPAKGTPVIMTTSSASISEAVGAMQLGAVDYLPKPLQLDELLASLVRCVGRTEAPSPMLEHAELGILGESPPIIEMRARIRKLAPSDATVLVLGASGTGKELVARALHTASGRAGGPFIVVNCAAIPEKLVESELFGHERGAFTGATAARPGLIRCAEGGTLFLDEIGELPLPVQALLLRFLQNGEVKAVGANRTDSVKTRLVAATHRDLGAHVRNGTFREDLYFRLRVLEIRPPALAERGSDVLLLARAFLRAAAARSRTVAPSLTREAEAAMLGHAWRGNVRELENAMERALVLSDGGAILPEHLALEEPMRAGETLTVEEYFRAALTTQRSDLTEGEIAKRLGVSRKTLWDRRRRFGLPRRDA